ncbi:MAG: transketolase [Candidatus Ranarchaeia archaeon]
MKHYDEITIEFLIKKSRELRRIILEMLGEAGSGHPGGSLSPVEIVSSLYYHVMNHDPKNPNMKNRDRFMLSKGHAAPLLYAILSDLDYFPKSELKTLRKINSNLQGHPDKNKLPGIEITSGSLGIGLSMGVGTALGLKMDKSSSKVYVLLGDGEIQEGQIWEAAMTASKYRLGNLVAILDRNGLQLDGPTERVMPIEPIAMKFRAFNWHVIEIGGYDVKEILEAFAEADTIRTRPTMIVAYTTKGKGVPYMEWATGFHGKVPNKEKLMKELDEFFS